MPVNAALELSTEKLCEEESKRFLNDEHLGKCSKTSGTFSAHDSLFRSFRECDREKTTGYRSYDDMAKLMFPWNRPSVCFILSYFDCGRSTVCLKRSSLSGPSCLISPFDCLSALKSRCLIRERPPSSRVRGMDE